MHLGPIDKWPTHSRPLARAALQEARATGWWFRPSSGHAFGRLRCSAPGEGEACVVPIYSTSGPEDGSETARAIQDAIRKCPHGRREAPQDQMGAEGAAQLASGRLAQVARLIDAAGRLLGKEDALRRAEQLIDEALEHLEAGGPVEVTRVEAAAKELERLAAVEDGQALAAAAQAGRGEPWPPGKGAAELVSVAASTLAELSELTASAEGSGEEARLSAELARLEERLAAVSTRLGTGR